MALLLWDQLDVVEGERVVCAADVFAGHAELERLIARVQINLTKIANTVAYAGRIFVMRRKTHDTKSGKRREINARLT